MSIAVSMFNSAPDFAKHVEKSITETKNALGIYMREIEEVRKRYDKTKKRYDTLKKLTGGKTDVLKDTKQIDVAGFKVLVNPTAEYELSIMEEAIASLQEKATLFEKAKELFPVLTDESMKVGMVTNDGIPTGFMLYIQE